MTEVLNTRKTGQSNAYFRSLFDTVWPLRVNMSPRLTDVLQYGRLVQLSGFGNSAIACAEPDGIRELHANVRS